MDKSVLIIMTVFNSEKYIEKQIDSIINQDYKNWTLIIQDDNSSDNTKMIVERYCKCDFRIKLTFNNTKRHGAYYNFHDLINKCKKIKKYDYYMFADHDDIWLPNKVSSMITYIEKKSDETTPTLLYGDMKIINHNGEVTCDSLNSLLGIEYKNYISTFFSHNVFGCNTIFNYSLFRIVPNIDNNEKEVAFLSHDNYFTKFAAIKGKILYYEKPLMLYRRYDTNVTSKQEYSYKIDRILSRVIKIQDLAKDHALTYNQSLYTIKKMKEIDLKQEEEEILNLIEKTIINGGFISLKFIYKFNVSWGKPVKGLSRTIILFLGLHKKYLIKD